MPGHPSALQFPTTPFTAFFTNNCGRGAAATPGSLDEMMLLNPFCNVLSGSATSADFGNRMGKEL